MKLPDPIRFTNAGLLDHLTEAVIQLDEQHRIVFTSELTAEISGYTTPEFLNKSLEELFPTKKTELVQLFDAARLSESIVFYTDFKRKDNSIITVRIRLFYLKENKQGYIIYLKDNTPFERVRKDLLKKTLTVEALSKSRKIRDGNLQDAIFEILEMASRAMNTRRVNAWLFTSDYSEIQCIGNFDSVKNKLVSQQNLPRIAMPNYFKLFESEKIIVTEDAYKDPKTKELLEIYLKPNEIKSLMDIPIRIEGEMIGVLCFEHTLGPRAWNLQEQKFGLVIAQMISLALETSEKQKARTNLEQALQAQKIMLQEVHHRVKNNLTIISSLLNLQSDKTKDEFHYKLFQESRDRLTSIATLHQLLYQTQSYSSINFKAYLEEILKNLQSSFNHKAKLIHFDLDIHPTQVDVSVAIPLALIVNELITNAFKHAFNEGEKGVISISLNETANEIHLRIADNGKGFDPLKVNKSSTGLDILEALISQIDAKLSSSSENGCMYEIRLNKV